MIRDHCSDFLSKNTNSPLMKTLPNREGFVERVKVRHKQTNDFVCLCFNEAFDAKETNLYSKLVFVNGDNTSEQCYYIFPVNGFKFLYCKEVKSLVQHCNFLHETMSSFQQKHDIIVDMLKMSYHDDSIEEAIATNCEIIIHSIPFFYAVKNTKPYAEVLRLIKEYKE